MELHFPTAKEALAPRSLEDINPNILAELLYEYFAAPAEESREVTTGRTDVNTGEPIRQTIFTKRPLPLISEFARICRLTQRELKLLGNLHPIVSRALEFACDIQEEYLLRRSLEGEWGVQATEWASMNLTKLRNKPPDSSADSSGLSEVLSSIEENGKPLLPAPKTLPNAKTMV